MVGLRYKMKIGIVTFFCVPNYGAMLQAYALWKYLEGLGHKVEFIDYAFGNARRIPIWKCFILRNFSNFWKIMRKKLEMYVRFAITDFADIYPKTARISSISALDSLKDKFDVVLVGSDQMWNPLWCSSRCLPVVMLGFVNKGVRRISYAVSFANTAWSESQNAEEARRLLKQFDFISVREKSGIPLVKELSGREDAVCVIDPTLLHESSFYSKLFNTTPVEPYVFLYILDEWSDKEEWLTILNSVQAHLNIRVIHTDRAKVKGALSPICAAFGVKNKIPVKDWIKEIASSQFVLTNSFHGTVFSILFHKPFITIPIRGRLSVMNERITNLLSMVGLSERMCSRENIDSIKHIIDQPIDWIAIDKKLSEERNQAVQYLDMALRKRGS